MRLSGKQYMFTFRHPVIVTLTPDPGPHQRSYVALTGKGLGTPGHPHEKHEADVIITSWSTDASLNQVFFKFHFK